MRQVQIVDTRACLSIFRHQIVLTLKKNAKNFTSTSQKRSAQRIQLQGPQSLRYQMVPKVSTSTLTYVCWKN